MKKTTNVSLGGSNFIIDEDAYELLRIFLEEYRKNLCGKEGAASADEITEEVEMRISDLLHARMKGREVVDKDSVTAIIKEMGFKVPDSPSETFSNERFKGGYRGVRKLYRDKDHRVIGGVCAGLARHLDIDVVVMRVIFAIALICGLAGFWIYLVFWIIVPEALTPVEKCEMNGEPATPDNIAKYV